MIDWTKPIQRKNGQKAEVIAVVDYPGCADPHVLIRVQYFASEQYWTRPVKAALDGKIISSPFVGTFDYENLPPPLVKTWAVFEPYPHFEVLKSFGTTFSCEQDTSYNPELSQIEITFDPATGKIVSCAPC
jgi:hypothetical protein